MEGSSQLLSNTVSINNQSLAVTNSTAATAITASVYVFTPVGFDTKLVLLVLLIAFGVIGLVGNILVVYFVRKKQSSSILQLSPFLRNFNLYVKSKSLSDIFSILISLPLFCTQIMLDVFQNGWPCKLVRYFGMSFQSIIINNLIAISVERFLSTCDVPKTFSVTTVRKLVYAAWIAGFLVSLAPAATMNGIRYDINATHYTMDCKYDTSYLPYRAIVVGYVQVQHVIPSIALICINIILARRVWKRRKRRIDVQKDNAIKATMRWQHIKTTSILIIITLAFVIPYSSLLYYAVYLAVAKPSIDFQQDFVMRYFSVVLIVSNSSINVIIYLVQMKDFRVFVMKRLCLQGNAQVNPI